MSEASVIGLDLAQARVPGPRGDALGRVVIGKQLRRGQVLEFFGRPPRCVVAMEACFGAQPWGRELAGWGTRCG